MKISVVINTLNEEKNIRRAIKSVESLADEIVVVDMKSDDDTAVIAGRMGARVYEHERTGYVEPARNYAISKAGGEWIFLLDADEEVPGSLAAEVKRVVKEDKYDYFRVPRRNYIFGSWVRHSGWWPDYNIRLFKKGTVVWSEIIHSVPETRGEGMDLEAREEYAILHHHYETIEQYVERLNRYTGVMAAGKKKEGYSFSWKDLIAAPSREFFARYFANRGYRDGLHGLALAGLQAFSEFVLYLKIWQMEKFEKVVVQPTRVVDEFRKVGREMAYWNADLKVSSGEGLVEKLRRKLRV